MVEGNRGTSHRNTFQVGSHVEEGPPSENPGVSPRRTTWDTHGVDPKGRTSGRRYCRRSFKVTGSVRQRTDGPDRITDTYPTPGLIEGQYVPRWYYG